jgi:hypothetical protein
MLMFQNELCDLFLKTDAGNNVVYKKICFLITQLVGYCTHHIFQIKLSSNSKNVPNIVQVALTMMERRGNGHGYSGSITSKMGAQIGSWLCDMSKIHLQ